MQLRAALGVKQEADDNNNDDSSADENLVDQRLANKKEKSLAYLAGSFIKLFFTWKETIPLEEAAWKLSPNDIDEHKIKTKVDLLPERSVSNTLNRSEDSMISPMFSLLLDLSRKSALIQRNLLSSGLVTKVWMSSSEN